MCLGVIIISNDLAGLATNRCGSVKARTQTPTFAGSALESALESADSSPESADSTNDFMRVGRLPVLNMFNIYTPIQSDNYCHRPTANRSSGYGP